MKELQIEKMNLKKKDKYYFCEDSADKVITFTQTLLT